MNTTIRIGQGFDSHRFSTEANRPLVLGGINIPHTQGLAGHSDADVLTHALIDSILGAINLSDAQDIGELFPDNDPQYKNISSIILLQQVQELLQQENYSINNIDITVICEQPKLKEYKPLIKEKLATVLNIQTNQIAIKAKTAEQMGALGRQEGIAVLAVCLVTKE